MRRALHNDPPPQRAYLRGAKAGDRMFFVIKPVGATHTFINVGAFRIHADQFDADIESAVG